MRTSINQNRIPLSLPELRNLGTILRILLLVNAVVMIAAFVREERGAAISDAWVQMSAVVEPHLLCELLILYLLAPWLERAPYAIGASSVMAVTLAVGLGINTALAALIPDMTTGAMLRHVMFSLLIAGVLLFSETALEDLADLFRVLMRDNRQLAPLSDEVELCRQYLDLEKLRLGERLTIEWHIDNMPRDAQVPPLLLQPLLENAVYHGIERSSVPGVIAINIFLRRGEVHAILRNPYKMSNSDHGGNNMALANIRERLALHFDAEASLASKTKRDSYEVHIRMPYHTYVESGEGA